MQANAYSQYALKDLHQAIDLMDRKIIYSTTLEAFESQAAREAHLRKLSTKRAALVKSALALASLGVRCDPKFLPRSFIHPVEDDASCIPAAPVVAEKDRRSKPAAAEKAKTTKRAIARRKEI